MKKHTVVSVIVMIIIAICIHIQYKHSLQLSKYTITDVKSNTIYHTDDISYYRYEDGKSKDIVIIYFVDKKSGNNVELSHFTIECDDE